MVRLPRPGLPIGIRANAAVSYKRHNAFVWRHTMHSRIAGRGMISRVMALSCIVLGAVTATTAQQTNVAGGAATPPGIGAAKPPHKGEYFGERLPGETPVVFATGIVSLEGRLETYPTFSPDGKTLYFSVVNGAWTEGRILYTRLENGVWTKPEAAPFSDDRYINWESFISPDGKRMFFASNRPPSSGMDIWMVERTSDASWSAPVRLPDPVNSAVQDGSPCITNNGSLYFKSLRTGGTGGSWLYRAIQKDGVYAQIESLGNIIKTTSGETEPFMSPDESYLIFASGTREGGNGGWDLWICFRQKDGAWTEPVNLGSTINTAGDEYGPRVSPDGKYLLFTREKRGESMDIYWVAISAIEKLRP